MSLLEFYDAVAPGPHMIDLTAYDPSSHIPAFEQQYGMPYFEYLRQHPDGWTLFNLRMEYGLQELVPAESIPLLDLPTDSTVADIGGGYGYLLEQAKLLDPAKTTILCEQAFVCEQARLFRGGIDVFSDGDIFAGELPSADTYLLTRVIHDWPDEVGVQILRNIHKVAPKKAQLRIIDVFLNEDRQGPPHAVQQDETMKLLLGSKQHTVSELGKLLLQSGWSLNTEPISLSDDMSCLSAKLA